MSGSGAPPAPVGPEVRAVVFDIGGVLLDWDPRHLYRKLIADEAERERFLTEVCSPAWHAAQDLGETIAASCAALVARHPEHRELIAAWEARNEEMVAGVIAGSAALLDALVARDIPCYALTNMEPEAYARRAARYSFMVRFSGTVVSSTEQIAKPDPEIYARLVARYRLDPPATLYIDDRAANLPPAAALGLRTHLFASPDALRAELVALRLLEPA